jgi:hypothetical protein
VSPWNTSERRINSMWIQTDIHFEEEGGQKILPTLSSHLPVREKTLCVHKVDYSRHALLKKKEERRIPHSPLKHK